MAVLVELTGAGQHRYPLGARSVLGRDPACSVPLPDPAVSRRHAEIRRIEEGAFALSDLGSTHGTFVRGSRVTDEVLLVDGDEILVGQTRLRFELADAPAAAPPADPGHMRTQRWRALVEPLADADSEPTDAAELRLRYRKLRAALELSRAIGVERYLPVLVERVLETAFRLLKADRGAVLLLDPRTSAPVTQIARRRDGKADDVSIPQTIVQEILRRKEGVLSADAGIDARFREAGSILVQGIRSTMTVPMLWRGELLGLLHLDSQRASNVFSPDDLDIFGSVASQAAMVVKNAMLGQEVVETMSRLEGVVRLLPHGLFLVDGQHRVVLKNPKGAELLPLLASGDSVETLGSVKLEALLEAPGEEVEVEVAGPPPRVLAISAGAARDGHAESVVLVRDVTQERERDERAARAYQLALVGQLAGGVAHDFNNHLSVILGHADMLLDTLPDGENKEDLELIRGAARRAATLTRQLLTFSRRDILKPVPTDLNWLLGDMQKLVARALGENGRVVLEGDPELWTVKVDPGRMEQAVLNLVVNARDAMPQGGTLTFRTSNVVLEEHEELPPGPYVRLDVTDTGEGMSPEVAARVFEPFFTTKARGKGTGLGLATVYGAVKQAGGDVSLASELGRGTTFTILLPAVGEVALAAPAAPPTPAPRGSGRVLVVEDEGDVRSMTARILRDAGYEVLVAGHAAEALSVVADGRPLDLLLTDVVMPGTSGRQLAAEISAARPDVRVLFMSGYPDEVIDGHGLLQPGIRLLQKPFTARELLEAVRAALD